jgi:hypothetical protein
MLGRAPHRARRRRCRQRRHLLRGRGRRAARRSGASDRPGPDRRVRRHDGRSYGVEPDGTVFPDSGPGIARLDRNEYAALKEIARADGEVEKVVAFQRDPRFLNHPEAIAKAKSIYDGTYTP